MTTPSLPLASAFHHVSITVKNLDVALPFYREVFAFPERPRLNEGASQNRGAWLVVNTLELHLQERPAAAVPLNDQHFGLWTEHFDEIVNRVRALGGRVQEARLLDGLSRRCFVYDLDGNKIELLQR